MALTSGNVTLKLSGGNYSTLAGFWNDLGNLTGDITCTVDASQFNSADFIPDVTESLGGYTLHFLPASFPTKTDCSDGARFVFSGYNGLPPGIEVEGPGTLIIEGIVFNNSDGLGSRVINLNSVDTEFTFIVRRNIMKGFANYGIYHNDATVNSGTQFYNNIIYDCGTYGIAVIYDIPSALIANNTVNNCGDGIECGDEKVAIQNCLSYGNIDKDFQNIEVLTNGYNNADSDSTGEDADWGGTGSGNVSGISDPFNNLVADDFTITAEGVIGSAGLDLSENFTTDFFGVTRSNWTIGACEYVSAPPPGGGQVIIIRILGAAVLMGKYSRRSLFGRVLASLLESKIT